MLSQLIGHVGSVLFGNNRALSAICNIFAYVRNNKTVLQQLARQVFGIVRKRSIIVRFP